MSISNHFRGIVKQKNPLESSLSSIERVLLNDLPYNARLDDQSTKPCDDFLKQIIINLDIISDGFSLAPLHYISFLQDCYFSDDESSNLLVLLILRCLYISQMYIKNITPKAVLKCLVCRTFSKDKRWEEPKRVI